MLSLSLKDWVPGFFCFMQHFLSFSLFWSQSELSKSYEDCSFLMFFNCRRLPNKCEGLCGTMTQVKIYLRFPTFRRIRFPKISDKLRFLDLFIGGSRAEGNTSGAAGDSQYTLPNLGCFDGSFLGSSRVLLRMIVCYVWLVDDG